MAEPPAEVAPRRAWANSSVAAAVLWTVLATLPVPGTTVIGLPFGLYAIFAGFFSHRDRRAAGDWIGARRARWGIGLGCVGFIIAFALDLVVVGVVLAAVIAAARAVVGLHFR